MKDAIQTILNTRDFCGNEKEALAEWEAENGELSGFQRSIVWQTANEEWSISQIESGVKFPLNQSDRAKAFADIESGH